MSPPPLDIVILGGSYAGLAVAHKFLNHTTRHLSTFQGAPTYRIVLVSPSTHVYWNICSPRILVSPSLVNPEDVFLPIHPALSRHSSDSVIFVQGRATGIDTTARKVMVERNLCPEEDLADPELKASSLLSTVAASDCPSVSRGTSHHSSTGQCTELSQVLRYHALILATGSSTYSPLFSLHGTHEETIAGLDNLHSRIRPAQSVLIVGGGPTGVETAGQLGTHYNRRGRRKTSKDKRRLHATTHHHAMTFDNTHLSKLPENKDKGERERDSADSASMTTHQDNSFTHTSKHDSGICTHSDVKQTTDSYSQSSFLQVPKDITLLSGSTRLLPHLSLSLGAKTEKKLRKQGVRIIHNLREVSHVLNADGSTTCILNNGTVITTDVYISATGVYPNTDFAPKAMLNADRYVRTDPRTLRVKGSSVGPRVYAIGDCASYSRQNLSDVYGAVPVLIENLKNDLLEHEVKLQTVAVVLPRARTPKSAMPGTGSAKSKIGKTAIMPKEGDPQLPLWLPRPHIVPLSPISEDQPYFTSPRTPPKPPPTKPTARVKSIPVSSEGKPPRFELQIYPPTSPTDSPPPPTTTPPVPTPTPQTPPAPLPKGPFLTPSQAAQKISTLKDAHYTQPPSTPSLMPTSRFGLKWGIKLPSCAAYFFKGRKYNLGNAKRIVQEGKGVRGLGV